MTKPINWYTEKENNFIKDNYINGTMTRNQICKALGKSEMSMKSFLRRHHIVKQEHKPWTEDDIEEIRLHYKQNPTAIAYLAKRLGRSIYAIKAKAAELGYVKSGRRFWSEDENEFLRDNVGRFNVAKLSDMLHRSNNAIILHMKTLKLHRKDRVGWYTSTEVAGILGCSRQKINTLIIDKKLSVVPHNGRASHDIWEITRESLQKFICRYPGELQGRNVDIVQVVDILTTNGVIYNLKTD